MNLVLAAAEDNQLMTFQVAHELLNPWIMNKEIREMKMAELDE
jgi:hypothetical protein